MAANRKKQKTPVAVFQKDPGPWSPLLINWLFTLGVILVFGIVMLFSSFTTGLFYLGCGLMGLGAVLIGFPLLYWICRAIIQGIANFAKFLYKKIYKNRRQGGNEQ